MERSGRTKVAISPFFVEPGTRLGAGGERRWDMGQTGRRTLSMRMIEQEGDETTSKSMSLRRVYAEETETQLVGEQDEEQVETVFLNKGTQLASPYLNPDGMQQSKV